MRAILNALIRGYQYFISPLLGPSCRFHPSCSQYAREALELHPLPAALWLSLRRVLRCHPWHPGGHDPVPTALPVSSAAASSCTCPTPDTQAHPEH
jgi:hypothetical protein